MQETSPADIEAQWQANLADAEALGVFGTPTYVVDGELFWGQDRLDFVDRKLSSLT
ncbi:DSBA-like thioredoxin domain protein [compost metagenome]